MTDTTDEKTERLQHLIDRSERIVFFGGAGVSTESGLADFRSVDGLYNQKYDFPPEEILSHTFFETNPKIFYKFYRERLSLDGIKPNATHDYLAHLEKEGKLSAVVTQNIDGLHQAAGNKNVFELHGSLHRNYCTRCGKKYPLSYVAGYGGIPYCSCGGIVRPDVVLYEEPLNEEVMAGAVEQIMDADLLIVAGTSLAVYPAASFIGYYTGRDMVLINLSETPYDSYASLVIHEKLGNVFSKLK